MEFFEGRRETSVLLKAIANLHDGQDGLLNLGLLIGQHVIAPRVSAGSRPRISASWEQLRRS
jgi:hypothetical protein